MKIPRDAPKRKVIKALERLVSKLEELDLSELLYCQLLSKNISSKDLFMEFFV